MGYECFHATALEAGKPAEELGAKNLIIYHSDDHNLDIRKEAYTKEVKENYSGNVYVPDDLEIIEL